MDRVSSARCEMRMLVKGAAVLAAASGSCVSAPYVFTEASSTAWCNADNWSPPMGEPPQIPPDGAEIIVPAGKSADMFSCPNAPLRVLGEISAEGEVRFWSPVAFAGGGSLTDARFEFSTDPVPVSGVLTLSGEGTSWAGGIFEGGQLFQTGTMTVTSAIFGARPFPRVLRSGCLLANEGTLLMTRSFDLGTAGRVQNNGTIRFSANSSILLEAGATGALIESPGLIVVDAGVGASVQPRLESSGPVSVAGALVIQGDAELTGSLGFSPGGSVRVTTPAPKAVRIAGTVIGDGTLQLEGGDIDLDGAAVAAGESTGRGVLFLSAAGVELLETVTVVAPGRVTLGSGRVFGDDPSRATPHLLIAPGGWFEAVSGPGFAGGGDLVSMRMVIDGAGLQHKSIRLLGGSRIEMGDQGLYTLNQARVDGDEGSEWIFRGSSNLVINDPPFGGNTAWIRGVRLRLEENSTATLRSGVLVAQENTPADLPPVELADNAKIRVSSGGDWRAHGTIHVTDGQPRIEGEGLFTLQTGATMLLGDGAALTADLDLGFIQGGSIGDATAEPDFGGRIVNTGLWFWNSGAIGMRDRPDGAAAFVNEGVMQASAVNGQLRCDLDNPADLSIFSNIVLAAPGVEIINRGIVLFFTGGGVSDLSVAREGRFVNLPTGQVFKGQAGGATIGTTVDNQGSLTAGDGTLTLTGPVVQIDNGVLRGGKWRVWQPATLRTPGQIVEAVAAGADVRLQGSWPEFLPRINEGTLSIEKTLTLPEDFQNFGDMKVTDDGKLVGTPGRRYAQDGGSTTVQPGGELDWPSIDLRAGELGGSGTVTTPSLENSGGVVTPGTPPDTQGIPRGPGAAVGALRVVGGYAQGGSGTLRIEVAGDAGPGVEGGHDLLEIQGAGMLGGRLVVDRVGAAPPIGSIFSIVTATGGLVGEFAAVEQDAPVDGVRFAVAYEPGGVRLIVTCSADLAPPVGLLDLADITAFVGGFVALEPIADLAEPIGLFDLADITAFVGAFTSGCLQP